MDQTAHVEHVSKIVRYNADLLRDALIEFHQFVCEHLDKDNLPVSGYLAWDIEKADLVQQLVDCNDPVIREYSHLIWGGGWRLSQAFVTHNESLERTIYVRDDENKKYVIVADA